MKAVVDVETGGRGVPLYFRLRSLLEDAIHSGVLPAGTQLPSEHVLSSQYGVSRATVREALRDLVGRRLIVRHAGKGSFVRELGAESSSATATSIDDLWNVGRRGVTRDVTTAACPAPVHVLRRLALPAGSHVVTIRAVREVDGRPIAWTTAFVPLKGRRPIRKAPIKRSLLDAVDDRGAGRIASAVTTVRAAVADRETAARLNVELASPVILVESLILAADGTPLQLIHDHYRADRFALVMRLDRTHGRWEWRQ